MRRMTLTNPDFMIHRPKPPVDPRVKAMDTLDTGMTLLAREDVPDDEKLKQYDQALSRYMNVILFFENSLQLICYFDCMYVLY